MIDEEGRPRPIKVDIAAELKIDGSRNVIGEQAVLARVAGKGMEWSEKSPSSTEVSEVGSIGVKRKRAESEPVEGKGKKARVQ